MSALLAWAIVFWLVVGLIFTLVAGVGLLKLADPMTRLHAPTKAGTVGTGAFLMASMVHSVGLGHSSFHEVLILAFLFVTAPVSANFISRVNIHRRTCDISIVVHHCPLMSIIIHPSSSFIFDVHCCPSVSINVHSCPSLSINVCHH